MKSKNYPSISGFGFAYSKVKKREKRDREIGGKGEGGREGRRKKGYIQGVRRPCSIQIVQLSCRISLSKIPNLYDHTCSSVRQS